MVTVFCQFCSLVGDKTDHEVVSEESGTTPAVIIYKPIDIEVHCIIVIDAFQIIMAIIVHSYRVRIWHLKYMVYLQIKLHNYDIVEAHSCVDNTMIRDS